MAKSKKWELVLKEVESLVGHSNGILYDRVEKLAAVFADAGFRQYHEDVIDAMEEHLDKYLGDYGISFADANLMLRYYPARAQWEGGKLREMLAESLDRQASERAASATPRAKTQRQTVTRKDFEQVQKQVEQEALRAKSLATQLADTRKSYDELLAENKQLRHDLARAEGRIAELERLLDREYATA